MKRSRPFIALSFLVVSCFLALPSQAAVPRTDQEPFTPYADEFGAAIVMTPGKHEVLYAFKPDQVRVAASLTKLPNAIAFTRLHPAWEKVVSLKSVDEVGGGRLRVASGSLMTLKDLFYSSVTASANNAATALARLSALGSKRFVQRMNDEAKRVGAKHSKFYDASGMDPRNLTTARDIALIAEAAFKDKNIQRAASSFKYEFVVRSTGEHKTLTNTNKLLTHDPDLWVVGGKTGYLEESKYNLVVHVRPMTPDGKAVLGKDLLVTVLGSPTKDASFATAKRLAQWAWQQYEF